MVSFKSFKIIIFSQLSSPYRISIELDWHQAGRIRNDTRKKDTDGLKLI